jgi:hypothetical protein
MLDDARKSRLESKNFVAFWFFSFRLIWLCFEVGDCGIMVPKIFFLCVCIFKLKNIKNYFLDVKNLMIRISSYMQAF